MEKIIIYDDFFSATDLQKIKDFCDNNWLCNCLYSPNTDETRDTPFWRKEYMEEHLFNTYLKDVIREKLNKKVLFKRLYSVGQTFGQNSNFHTDDKAENSFTFCFYINDNTDTTNDNTTTTETNEGYYYVKIPNEKHILAIEPLNNRGVLFPGSYVHKGTGFNKFSNDLRVCIAWKFTDITNTNTTK